MSPQAPNNQPGAPTPPAFPQANPPAMPPALPSIPPYHFGINGEIKGPFEAEEIANLLAAGEVDGKTLAWTAGMSDWTAVSDLEDFTSLLAAMPPPMPSGPKNA